MEWVREGKKVFKNRERERERKGERDKLKDNGKRAGTVYATLNFLHNL